MSARRPPKSSRAASFFLLLGCCTVLGVTFATGVFAGRQWPQLLPSLGAPAAARASKTAARSSLPAPSAGERPRPAEPAPVLTFYQELTAPLTSPPPAPKKTADKLERAPKVAAKAEMAKPEPGEGKFTIQVGAFRTRDQADAIRARLSASGQDAYIAELPDGPPGARYRVRVGSFATRDEARRAAQRLAAGSRLSTYVTTR